MWLIIFDEIVDTDIGEVQWAKKGNTNYHHEGYDTKAKSIEKEIENYLNANPPEADEKVVLWITGIGTGGAIANIVAGDMINNNSNKKGIMREVYCYTYGAPLTVYNNGK